MRHRLLWLIAPLRLRRRGPDDASFVGYWELPSASVGRPLIHRRRFPLLRDWWAARRAKIVVGGWKN